MKKILKKTSNFIAGKGIAISLFLAVVFFLFSIRNLIIPSGIGRQVSTLQERVRQRQILLEEYAYELLDLPLDQWPQFESFPYDMVLYRYNADTLHSWINEFPIDNDNLNYTARQFESHKLHYVDWQNEYIRPLSHITKNEQYINIGSRWYIAKLYTKDSQKIIAALLVKTEPRTADATDSPVINPKLALAPNYDIEPISSESTNIVVGKEGRVLFSLVENMSSSNTALFNWKIWLSILFLLIALFLFFHRKRSGRNFLIFLSGISLLRLLCFVIEHYVEPTVFFSPKLYADTALFDSLGDLLLNNLYIALVGLSLFMAREMFKLSDRIRIVFFRCASIAATVLIFVYINYTLRSLVNNSLIVMELHRINEITPYTLLCYLSFALLFLVGLLFIHLSCSLFKIKGWQNTFSTKNIFLYSAVISLYTLFTISFLGIGKEAKWAMIAADNIMIERDLDLELELRNFENRLSKDEVFAKFLENPGQNVRQIEQRFSELYFQKIKQKYHINVTICGENDVVQNGRRVESCISYFASLLNQYSAEQIYDNSAFYYLSNLSGRLGYLGTFYYNVSNGTINLFVEINTKYDERSLGYPAQLSEGRGNFISASLPAGYSFSKYHDGKILFSEGDFSYPQTLPREQIELPVSQMNGYIHFVYKAEDDDYVVISRRRRSIFPYFVSLSYLILFFWAIFYVVLNNELLAKKFRNLLYYKKRRTIRHSLTIFITLIISVTLIAAGFGSLFFSRAFYERVGRIQLENTLQSAQHSLSQFSELFKHYASFPHNDAVSMPVGTLSDLTANLERLADEIHSDINIWSPRGELITSTKQELFSNYTIPSRMKSEVYRKMAVEGVSKLFNQERIGGFKYVSLYSAVYSEDGNLSVIINIPYFSRGEQLNNTITPIVATIINLMILLMIFAILFARLLSRRVTRPIEDISNKMRKIDVTIAPQHIEYSGSNELGDLIASYNKMVDSLSESTKQLARSEREKAWSDMARQIAHEIKNPLTPMKLSIQRLIKLRNNNPEMFEQKFATISDGILEQIDILSNTASEFSSYAKFYVEDAEEFNLCTIAREQSLLFDNRDNLRILFTAESEECFVYARKGQIIRVLVNLITNAIQALEKLEEKGFVKISIESEEKSHIVKVEDNGNGVSDENLSKLFSPNFTTKSSGNGLGLAISKSIVEQSGGKIWHQKSDLGGACFAFSLPKSKS